MNLDDIDRRILDLLQVDCRMPIEIIGDRVGLSASSAHRRIQRLRQQRVIVSEIAVLDPKALGRSLVMIVELAIQHEEQGHLQSLRAWISDESAIQQCWYVTGDADFILIVTVRDVEDFERLMQRLLTENPNVRNFKTAVTLSTVKRGLRLATDDPDTAGATR